MKKILTILVIALSIKSYSQKNTEKRDYIFGSATNEEINLLKYDLDTTANAVVLSEFGNTKFKIHNNRVVTETKYYYKIKIFNKEGFKHGTFEIPIYNNKKSFEKVVDIKGITTNNHQKIFLNKSNIFNNKITENWSEVAFTMPNLKSGSVIEVQYTLRSPFMFNLTGWNFQSEIPKKISTYKASIPGNYVYNRKLLGYLKLKTNTSTIKKKCFSLPSLAVSYGTGERSSDCEEIVYAMENIPAFVEEDYMTDKDNFLSRIKFELSETIWFDGTKHKYTKTWDDVDKEFRKDKNIGRQLKKENYFKDLIPTDIQQIESDIERAKAVYYFIQNHFTWNKKYSIFKNVNIKSAFEDKVGNVGEINISLINALKSVGLNAELVALSTRQNGFVTKLYPVISDFNYVIAKLNINDNYILLDATDKMLPFDLLPFRCLNRDGRVMDFENNSYWISITPKQNNKIYFTCSLELKEDGSLVGKLRKSYYGYEAYFKRKKIQNTSEDDLISNFENNFNDLEVSNCHIKNKTAKEKPLIENYDIEINEQSTIDNIYLNPYFDEKYSVNPFKQEDRKYPVDFGYQKNYTQYFSLEVPDNFIIDSYPKQLSIKLPENSGNLSVHIRKIENYKLTMKTSFNIKKPIFYNFEYAGLKEIFKLLINTQKTPIVLKKVILK